MIIVIIFFVFMLKRQAGYAIWTILLFVYDKLIVISSTADPKKEKEKKLFQRTY